MNIQAIKRKCRAFVMGELDADNFYSIRTVGLER